MRYAEIVVEMDRREGGERRRLDEGILDRLRGFIARRAGGREVARDLRDRAEWMHGRMRQKVRQSVRGDMLNVWNAARFIAGRGRLHPEYVDMVLREFERRHGNEMKSHEKESRWRRWRLVDRFLADVADVAAMLGGPKAVSYGGWPQTRRIYGPRIVRDIYRGRPWRWRPREELTGKSPERSRSTAPEEQPAGTRKLKGEYTEFPKPPRPGEIGGVSATE